ncbi:MAG: amino acid adenylation domain-containing protein [Rhodospirillaceae bacterium]|nr:amino acid adenylation domain-containing protein [Rhodospirillaceae bacterium]
MRGHNVGLAFERVAAAHADRTALRFHDSDSLTYAELDNYSARLARRLIQAGIRRGDVVALFVEKGRVAYGVMIACLRLGAIYTHLDPSGPATRQRRILERCKPVSLIVDAPPPAHMTATCDELQIEVLGPEWNVDGEDAGPLHETADVTGSDPAYIMFTSGSTGFPKGAVISHGALLNFRSWASETFGLTPDDVLTNVNPLYFDNSVFDFYAALLNGCSLAVFGRDVTREARTLVQRVEEAKCTVWFSVPSLLMFLTTMRAVKGTSFPTLRAIIFGGEGYPKSEMKKLFDMVSGRTRLFNVYGPTECTCICSSYEVTKHDFEEMEGLAPLGRMAPNFSSLLLDGDRPVNVGEAGELCLLGPQVGLGYYNDDERSAAAFTPNPLNPNWTEIIYRTGDLVTLGEDGLHRFVGRKDNQIKHMGYRIELEEIENALYAVDRVTEAAAAYIRERAEFGRIVAAVATDQSTTSETVRAALEDKLPAYMIPGDIKVMEHLPKNANGKIDRNAVAKLFQL